MDANKFNQLEDREIIARRAALVFKEGQIVNLGFGMPTQAVNYLPEGIKIILHTENGAFGFGGKPKTSQSDCDITNAGTEPITLLPGACIMDLTTSFGAMRNGYVDITVLGALEVDQEGNISNWATKRQGKWWPGIGGAMDLCYGVPIVVAALAHTDKKGNSKIKRKVSLPKTGTKCVKIIVTDKAVFNVGKDKLILMETAPGLSVEDIRKITEADFEVSDNLKEIDLDLSIG
jgi:3-oxoacid CoA-transferase subunit B/acetate CoA/acetoacetate CoA-transferase beta subunit